MKFIVLAVLLMGAPAVRAQNAPPPNQLATIDPAARDLLARTQARYQKFETFESLISVLPKAQDGSFARRFRVQMAIDGRFVVGEEYPDKSWSKSICDGKTLVSFDSHFPGRYTRESVESALDLGWRVRLEAALNSVDARSPMLSMMLSDDIGADLLSTYLTGVEIADDGAFQKISMRGDFPRAQGQVTPGALQFWIEPKTLALDHASVVEGDKVVYSEVYSQTRFDPKFDEAMFRAAAPQSYRLIDSFETAPQIATPPMIQ